MSPSPAPTGGSTTGRFIAARETLSVPVASVALIALGALVLANMVAALPGRLASRTPTALLLHSEWREGAGAS